MPVLAQYTLILHASKAMPKQCVDYLSGKVKPRRTVGVRMPGDAICQVPPAGHAFCRPDMTASEPITVDK